MRIGVFGHVGNQNLGDEALIAAVVQNVRRRCGEAELRGFTARPHDTSQRHRIPAFPIRRMTDGGRAPATAHAAASGGLGLNAGPDESPGIGARLRALLKRVPLLRTVVRRARQVGRVAIGVPAELAFLVHAYRHLRGTDLLLVAGSGQLSDYWGGAWGFPFTLFKWSLLARMTRTKVAFLSLGAGPLRTRLGKFFIKQTVRLAAYRSYRDDDSRRCIVDLGIAGKHRVVPDLVLSLDVDPQPAPPQSRGPGRRQVVGINPMPVFDDAYYPVSDPRVFGKYVETLAAFADWLIERGYVVRFFATQLLVDHGVIDKVQGRMQQGPMLAGEQRVFAGRIGSFEELVSVLDSVDFVVATRYHGTLFALIRHKPVLSIAYHPKSRELMRQMGRAEYAIDIAELTFAALQERFVALERDSAEFVAGVRQRLPEVRGALDAQYDHTFRLVEAVS